jgi:hypothetical protein
LKNISGAMSATHVLTILVIAASLAMAQQPAGAATPTGSAEVPAVPANIQVRPSNVLFLSGHAQGTQSYICLPSVGVDWVAAAA